MVRLWGFRGAEYFAAVVFVLVVYEKKISQ
jgi:hypothetical protein